MYTFCSVSVGSDVFYPGCSHRPSAVANFHQVLQSVWCHHAVLFFVFYRVEGLLHVASTTWLSLVSRTPTFCCLLMSLACYNIHSFLLPGAYLMIWIVNMRWELSVACTWPLLWWSLSPTLSLALSIATLEHTIVAFDYYGMLRSGFWSFITTVAALNGCHGVPFAARHPHSDKLGGRLG